MIQSTLKKLFCVAAVAVALTFASANSAQAGWHHWGGYYGGWGGYYATYYAPSYAIGYYRPCLWRHAYYRPVVYPRYSYYTPIYGSCCTSCYTPCYSTCYGPCACSSCCGTTVGCCESTGTVVQKHPTPAEPTLAPQEPAAPPEAAPADSAPVDSQPSAPADATPPAPAPAADEPSSILPDPGAAPDTEVPDVPASPALPPLPNDAQNASDGSAVLSVVVPEDARVYVNGKLTSTPGTHRQYVSHGLVPGYEYTYEIQAVVNRGGRLMTDKQVVQVRAGDTKGLAMNLSSAPAPTAIATSLKIHVPDNAQVQLEGRTMKATGTVRQFSTTGLAKGDRWDDYRVVVTMDRDGRPVTQEKTLTMVGGESHELRFDFGADLLASR